MTTPIPSSGNIRRHFFFLCGFLFFIIFFTSCGPNKDGKSTGSISSMLFSEKFDRDDFAGLLVDVLSDTSAVKGKDSLLSPRLALRSIYSSGQYQPIWLNEEGGTGQAEKLLADLDSIRWDGLDPEDYQLSSLQAQLQAFKKSKEIELAKVISLDTGLSVAYVRAAHDLLLGTIDPKEVDSFWFNKNDTVWKIRDAGAGLYKGQYTPFDSFRSRIPTYALLRNELRSYRTLDSNAGLKQAKQALGMTPKPSDSLIAAIIRSELPWAQAAAGDTVSETAGLLKAYQAHYGLKQTGKTDSATLSYLSRSSGEIAGNVRVNLERLRWLPSDIGNLYILVNIPLMELFFRKDGGDAMHMRVVVGKSSRQTPSLSAPMANVVINPPWGVPPTIMKRDVLPGMTKSGEAYLQKKGLEVFDHKGRRVDASTVNASNYRKFVFRQPPGDDNALGYVKFNLPNKWDIYLHDTPHREDFSKSDRARSSGCIRVQQPREMAEYILNDLNNKNFDQVVLDSMIKTQKTKYETLQNKIPVHIVYLTAFEDSTGTRVRFMKDIYKKDARVMAALDR